jgi:hypothetical protein
MGKYGTNLEGFGAFEGGVNADNGATLVSTNSDGEKSQLFGPASLREIQAGVANGDFEVLPNDATGAISESNPLPYFSFTDNSGGRIVASIADSTLAPGQTVLRFTLTNAVNADEVYFTRYVPIATSEARTYGNQVRVAIAAATVSANYRLSFSAEYVRADLSTTTGTSALANLSGSTMNAAVVGATAGSGAEFGLNPNGTGSAPADAAYLLIKLSVNATGSVASATLDIAELRIDRSQIQYLVTDQTLPDLYGPGALSLLSGRLSLTTFGVVGSESKLVLDTRSGDITLDATTQGKTITLTSANRTSSTVTIVTTRAHAFGTGDEVVVAGITGTAGTTMNGTYIVTVTNSTTFTYTSAGTAGSGTVTSATVKSGPGSGIIYLKPATTTAGRVQVEGKLVVSSLLTASGSVQVNDNLVVDQDMTVGGSVQIDDASANKDQITITTTTAGAGLTIGADTNLYRSAANTLKTDDSLVIGGANSLYVSRASVASAAQSLTNNTSTTILLDTASTTPTTGTYDPKSWFNNANDRIAIGQDGFYAVTANIAFAANATGRRAVNIIVNGSDAGGIQVLASPAGSTILSVSTNLYLAAGDLVTMSAIQQSGGALNTVVVAGVYPALSVGRIGA